MIYSPKCAQMSLHATLKILLVSHILANDAEDNKSSYLFDCLHLKAQKSILSCLQPTWWNFHWGNFHQKKENWGFLGWANPDHQIADDLRSVECEDRKIDDRRCFSRKSLFNWNFGQPLFSFSIECLRAFKRKCLDESSGWLRKFSIQEKSI